MRSVRRLTQSLGVILLASAGSQFAKLLFAKMLPFVPGPAEDSSYGSWTVSFRMETESTIEC